MYFLAKKFYLSLTQEILMEKNNLKILERMKLQTKQAFNSHGLKARLHRRFLRWFQARFRGDLQSPVSTTGDSNRYEIASSLHGRFWNSRKIAAEIAAKIASVNGP